MLITKFLVKYRYFSNRYAVKLFDNQLLSLNGALLTNFHTTVNTGDLIHIAKCKNSEIFSHSEQEIYVELDKHERPRIWRFHKPKGTLVTRYDAYRRTTIFDILPTEHRNLIAIGRLDYNTEGLLLLTNDGQQAQKMMLPSTQLEREYKCRISSEITQAQIQALEAGIRIDGIQYRSIYINKLPNTSRFSRNKWITMTLTEGKNREIRRVLKHFNIEVSRLIRIRYGSIRLDNLMINCIEEVEPFL